MPAMTRHDAVQLWDAAIDHSQAVLAVDGAARRAALTGSAEDDMKAIKAQHELEAAIGRLKSLIAKHVEETTA